MLRTERTYLRNLCLDDVSTLFDYRNDARCNQYQRYDDTSKLYLQNFVNTYCHCVFLSTEEEQHYAVICRTTNKMIGDISIFFSEKDNCFTLGITISPLYQHQGYAYEILSEVVSQLQKRYPSVDVVALIEKGNDKSISLFKKLDFVEECYADSIRSHVFVKYGKED